ncbi:DUF5367 family protein [Heyndrickxia oleronia]|uniref:DUF5367 family protein n=1 Tax=Heyndrickxia oleronia TaxID=38875 RepID=UPI001B2CF9B0|nr:DUF5367 family protein [Heyndrickxia oleronia]GIN40737.1 hypothetical protein J19TS1_36860 [Heyndrickxia oleronia]
MKGYIVTAVWGLIVWLFATLFFVLFGDRVLVSPGTNHYVISIVLLLIYTGLVLWGATYVYLLFDKTKKAALKFGVIGTIIGLALDTFSLSNHQFIFPKLSDSQIIAFTAWMSFAYALYLLIPAMIYKKRSVLGRE